MEQTDIKILRSQNVTDTDDNGGRENKASEVVSGVKFNLFPRVTTSERESGITRLRKVFMANMNTNGETAYGAFIGLSSPGNGGDRFHIAKGTQNDTQADTAGLAWTGCGTLTQDASAGDTQISITFKHSDYTIPAGSLIIIKDDEKSCTVRSVSSAFNGNTAVVTLENQLPDSFLSAFSYAGVMLELGDLAPSLGGVSVSSVAGSFDSSKAVLYNAGTESDTFSLVFTSSLAFYASGASAGSLSSGTVTSAYSPLNPKTGRPFFTLPAECFSGSFEAGNTISFTTSPASASVWIKETVPAGCPHEPNNRTSLDWLID